MSILNKYGAAGGVNPGEPEPLLTPDALARMLDLRPQTLAAWRVSGDGPKWIKMGRAVRYRRSDVDTWLDAQTRTSTSDRGDVRRSA